MGGSFHGKMFVHQGVLAASAISVFFHPGMITNIHGSVDARSITGLEGLARVFQAPMGILGAVEKRRCTFKHMMVPLRNSYVYN